MSLKTLLVAGSSHPTLAKQVAELAAVQIHPLETFHFPDGEIRVRLGDGSDNSVYGKQVFVLQSLGKTEAASPNDLLTETLLIVDALRREGAQSIVLVAPYLAYARQNVQETKGFSVASRLFADCMELAGVNHLVTFDLHAELVKSFYMFAVEHLTAYDLFVERLEKENRVDENTVIVGPDLGASKLVSKLSRKFSKTKEIALIEKRRRSASQVETLSLLGEVKGKNVLLADDMCSTAMTLSAASYLCREKGAKTVQACVTHGIFSDDAMQILEKSPIDTFFVSDTIDQKKIKYLPKFCVISVASTLAATLSQLKKQFEDQ